MSPLPPDPSASAQQGPHPSYASLGTFYRAEDYHQKYYLRRFTDLMRAFSAYSEREFEDSTAAMWLNACVAGEWKRDELAQEIERLGLPEAERQRMVTVTRAALAQRRR